MRLNYEVLDAYKEKMDALGVRCGFCEAVDFDHFDGLCRHFGAW
jgi:hypothetical protein